MGTEGVRVRIRSTAPRFAALVASAAMVVVGAQAGTSANAATDRAAGATALPLSASQRATALKDAQAETPTTERQLKLADGEKLVARDVVKDADGTTHTRYERTFDGLPVLGGDLVVHTAKGGDLKGTTKARKGSITVASTDAATGTAAAKKSAKSAAGNSVKGATAGSAHKVVWAADAGKAPTLAYETVVKGTQHDGTPSELHVITDADSGKVLYKYQAIENGTGASEYSGSVTVGSTAASGGYDLVDGERGGHKTYDLKGGTSGTGTLFHDADDKWGDGTAADSQTAAVDAAYGAAETWDFYKESLNRSGIAGDGKAAYSRVHYGNAYVNAFWDDSCFCMTYGDGIDNKNPLTSLDVAAHEMSHGLTAATANLNYSKESGGLNEATSDIFGSAVEFYANNSTDVGDYLIGEKIDINGDGSPLRYMDKPSKDGKSADAWSSSTGGLDVHYSSGVANHFFYLLSEGSGKKTINGVDYDSPTSDGSTVTGIGRDKAVQIWYKALSTYMTSTTDYAAARAATIKAAGDLYGASGAEATAVAAAWKAVNVN
ncbi:M4 family metallopeptidase [Streptomyces sp. NPDC102340]|uniref:M4 family metallopeptidase n=1 Tax=unclassified Streptomyces TaxID=2593676 RepID=UPI003809D2FB